MDHTLELARFACLPVEDLKREWEKVLGSAAPKNARRDYLLRSIAHELQNKAHGGIPRSLLRNLMKVAASEGRKATANATGSRSLKTGVRIYREWKGALHEVEVVDEGFRYNGAIFKTLSVIARSITGTRWSGPAFFGVKRNAGGSGNGR